MPRILNSPQAADRMGLPGAGPFKFRDLDERPTIAQIGLKIGYQLTSS